jgi:S1-C subfamily serine protease
MYEGVVETLVTQASVSRVRVIAVAMHPDGPGELGAWLVDAEGETPAAKRFERVAPDGAAARAGIADGDVLLAADGAFAVGDSVHAAFLYVVTRSPGTRMTLSLRRGAEQRTAKVAIPQ